MTKAEYLKRAEDCEEMAKLIVSDEARRKILRIALRWRELAEQSYPSFAAPRAA
jgi:hypothetical protein